MMKVALVHDFLIEYGGAERVLEALHEIWPKAPVYTAFYIPDSLGWHAKIFKNWKIISSWGTKLPFWQHLVSPYRIFAKSFFEGFDLSAFNLVISSSAMYMAKAVKVPNGIHICYCHTPPRHLYGYHTASDWEKNFFSRISGHVINHFMRVWDFETAQLPADPVSSFLPASAHSSNNKSLTDSKSQELRAVGNPSSAATRLNSSGRVDYFIANSKEVQARIKKFYRRDSTVIYPPVDVRKFTVHSSQFTVKKKTVSREQLTNYFLIVSRLVSAKKVDLAVEVCTKLGLPLKVVGAGRELESLKQLAKRLTTNDECQTTEFLGEVFDEELIRLYQNCKAVIFPAEQEDFGLVPVEAMAAGKPVIALAQGGVLESVIDQKTGVYFNEPSVTSLKAAVRKFIELEKKNTFDPKFIKRHAQEFSKERFKREIMRFVESKVK